MKAMHPWELMDDRESAYSRDRLLGASKNRLRNAHHEYAHCEHGYPSNHGWNVRLPRVVSDGGTTNTARIYGAEGCNSWSSVQPSCRRDGTPASPRTSASASALSASPVRSESPAVW